MVLMLRGRRTCSARLSESYLVQGLCLYVQRNTKSKTSDSLRTRVCIVGFSTESNELVHKHFP